LFNIAPKRANWDLKRDMEKKLAKLDRKTQESIHTLIRPCLTFDFYFARVKLLIFSGQRLASQKNGDVTLNLSAGIKAQQKAAEADEIEDVDSGDED
jgi:coiled-coil domain-containing protein 12